MKLLSVLFKKDSLKKSEPVVIKSNYACEDSELEWQIKTYLSRECSELDCLQGILE